jgi:hypothetical protein
MKINTSKNPNRFLSRKAQFQLFMLVALLGFIIIAMKKTAEPEFWYWMFPPEASSEEKDRPDNSSPRQEIQTFKFSSEETETSNVRNSLPIDFSSIKDDSLGVRHDEAGIYYSLLQKISSLSEKEIQKETLKGISYSILNEHPEDYRGQLIEIQGNLRGLTLLPLAGLSLDESPQRGDNEEARYYEGWVFTRSSGVNPYRVVCASTDQSLPLKQSYHEPIPVKVTGYFFKKQAYASQNGLNSAPLILADKIHLHIIRKTELQPISRFQKPLIWFVLIFSAALIFTFWSYKRSDIRSRLRMQRGKYLRQRLWVPDAVSESDVDDEEGEEEGQDRVGREKN